MKIGVVTTVHYNDDNRIFKKEIISLVKTGAQIVYFAPGEMKEVIKDLEYINVSLLGKSRFVKIIKIFKLLRKSKVQLLHFHDPELMILGLIIKMFTRIKVFYDVHEDYPSDIRNKAYLSRISKVIFYVIVKSLEYMSNIFFDGIITADEKIQERFNKKKSIVVFNYPILEQYKLDHKLNFDDRTYDIVYAGMLTENMVINILKAVRYVINKGFNPKVLLVSPFNFSGGIEKVVKYLERDSLSNFFSLRNRVSPDEIPNILSVSKVGIIPLENTEKMRKNIPTKLFEYMAAGNIVVANDLPPIRKYDCNGDFVFFCDTSSDKNFGEAIIKALNLSNYSEISDVMRQLVFSKYNWTNEEKKLVNFYDWRIYGNKK